MKAIFLDIDGVLNWDLSTETYTENNLKYLGIDDERVERLATIVKCSAAKIILVSDWKDGYEVGAKEQPTAHGRYLDEKLAKYGLTIYDKTDHDFKIEDRGANLLKYLQNHPEIEEYVIIDDSLWKYGWEGRDNPAIKEHFIKTQPNFNNMNMYSGLTDGLVLTAVKILHNLAKGMFIDPVIREEIRREWGE